MKTIQKPKTLISGDYFNNYVTKAQGEDLIESLRIQSDDFTQLLNQIPKDKARFRYQEGKWSIKQLVQHIIDTERIFAYRALRFSRQDKTSLSSFDENHFANNDYSDLYSIEIISREFRAVRQSTILLFEKMHEEVLDFEGCTSHNKFTPRVLGWILCGHLDHHIEILKTKYL